MYKSNSRYLTYHKKTTYHAVIMWKMPHSTPKTHKPITTTLPHTWFVILLIIIQTISINVTILFVHVTKVNIYNLKAVVTKAAVPKAYTTGGKDTSCHSHWPFPQLTFLGIKDVMIHKTLH